VVYIGLDDTDNLESRGTGHLARLIAADLAGDFPIAGVTRHQLLVHPDVPYTAKNSSAAILLVAEEVDIAPLARRVAAIVANHRAPGSDPGLAMASIVPGGVLDFGRRAQREVVDQMTARRLASVNNITLNGLGGSQDGVIGALAAVGLAASGGDGRYVLVGQSRELAGLVPVDQVLSAGIAEVRTQAGQVVLDGVVRADKLRPARRGGRPILFVQEDHDAWQPLKLD
jgi:tRNA(Ile2) C34 agmatinyltransferase TiaS